MMIVSALVALSLLASLASSHDWDFGKCPSVKGSVGFDPDRVSVCVCV